MNNSNAIAIDDGSSQIKVVSESCELSFQSAARKGNKYTDDGISDSSYNVLGESYSVTDTPEPIKTNCKEYQSSEVNRVFIYEALSRLGVNEPVDIGLTIPVGSYYTESGLNHELINSKIENVKKTIAASNNRKLPEVKSVKVFAESIMGFRYVKQLENLSGYSLCVDIGGFTTDLAVFIDDDIVDFKTIENGSMDCIKKLKRVIKQKFNHGDLPNNTAEKALRSGKYNGEDLSIECGEIIKEMINTAISAAKSLNDIKSCNNLVFIGGGARFVKRYSKLPDNAYIPEQPEMANARGLYMKLNGVQSNG